MIKAADIAESIIRSEGFTFALAVVAGKEGDLREARDILKRRLVKELNAAAARGEDRIMRGDI